MIKCPKSNIYFLLSFFQPLADAVCDMESALDKIGNLIMCTASLFCQLLLKFYVQNSNSHFSRLGYPNQDLDIRI